MNVKKMFRKGIENTYVLYTVLFIVFFVCVFSPFWNYGKAFLWTTDGMTQDYPMFIYVKKWASYIITTLAEKHYLSIPFWDMTIGFGQDVFGNGVAFRPLTLISLLFSASNVENYMLFRTVIYTYLSGVAFIFFMKKRTKEDNSILIGALIYVFSAYALYFAPRHPFFFEMMIYFPLMLVGVEQIFKKKKSMLFTIIVFLCGASYFHFLYIITLAAVVYALFRYFELYAKEIRSLKHFINIVWGFFLHYILGVLLAAFSILPSIMKVFDSGRGTGSDAKVASGFFWDLSYYQEFLLGITDIEPASEYRFMVIPGIAIFALLYMLVKYRKKTVLFWGQFVFYTVAFLVPAFAMMFNAGASRSLRWACIYMFWIAAIVVKMLPRMLQKSKLALLKSCVFIAGYLLIYMFISQRTAQGSAWGCIWLFIYAAVLLALNATSLFEKRKPLVYMGLIVLLCIETTMQSYALYSATYNNYISEFVTAGKVESVGKNNTASALELIDDSSVYRVDVISSESDRYNQINYGMRNDVNGVSNYLSFSNSRIRDYSWELGNSAHSSSLSITDLSQRTALDTLASVKYMTVTEGTKGRVPYGYEEVASREKIMSYGTETIEYLYQNKNYLPLMYVYNSYIPIEEFEKLEVNEKEQAMLQGVVLEEIIQYPKTQLDFDYIQILDKDAVLEQLRANYSENKNIEIGDDYFEIENNNTELKLNVDKEVLGDVFFLMEDVMFESKNYNQEIDENTTVYTQKVREEDARTWKASNTATITVKLGDKKDSGVLMNSTYQYFMGERDVLFNLGYTKTGELKIKFSKAGRYSFSDLKLICQPMESYVEKVNALKKTPVSDISVDGNYIFGNIATDEEKMVCIAVPYSTGWTAYIDYEEVKIYPANGMYMAIKVPEGQHRIKLVYRTPGLYLGAAISALALVEVIVLCVLSMKKRKRLGAVR